MTTDASPDGTTAHADDGLEGEAARVWGVLTDLYDAFLAGDRARLEAHLDEGCTMWDSTIPLLRTKADLRAGRGGGRTSTRPTSRCTGRVRTGRR